MIIPLTTADSEAMAQLHFDQLHDDFLPSFGLPFLRVLHQKLIGDPLSIGFCCKERKKLIGMVIATTNTRQLLKNVFISGFWKLTPFVVTKIITNPRSVKNIYETFFYGNNDQNHIKAELMIIAVVKGHQRQGIGQQLVQKVARELRHRGFHQYKVGTLSTNSKANAFYKKNGGTLYYSYFLYGKKWHVYRYNI
jgi:ribosomal protein S18 acetylase RimI-like enzyme